MRSLGTFCLLHYIISLYAFMVFYSPPIQVSNNNNDSLCDLQCYSATLCISILFYIVSHKWLLSCIPKNLHYVILMQRYHRAFLCHHFLQCSCKTLIRNTWQSSGRQLIPFSYEWLCYLTLCLKTVTSYIFAQSKLLFIYFKDANRRKINMCPVTLPCLKLKSTTSFKQHLDRIDILLYFFYKYLQLVSFGNNIVRPCIIVRQSASFNSNVRKVL